MPLGRAPRHSGARAGHHRGLRDRFHGWPISNLRGVRHYQIGGRETVEACDFDFPGRAGMPARWDIGDGQVWVSQCDVPAWEALRAQFEPKADGPAP